MITCGFIGLGLIGGSIARALKERVEDVFIIGYDIYPEGLMAALEDQVVDVVCDHIDEQFGSCDYVFLCAPVQKNAENLKAVSKYLDSRCIITDVGSVKTQIHEQVKELGLDAQFIGGHPMTGSERVGYINSKALLLENAYYILTPTDKVSKEQVDGYKQLVLQMGAIPLILNHKQHDYVTAAVSHLPHVIASSLVNLVRDSDSEEGIMKMIAAGGFKDITRIASSSAAMWQQICLTNTGNILSLLDDYITSLQQMKRLLEAHEEDGLYHFFDEARIYRDSFISASSGPIKISYSMNVDIADEPGALASIATILALNNISIKNIGIVHNREFEGGVLRIEFYDEEAVNKAETVLTGKGYFIYKKQ